jgi:hypothetical protein
VSGVRLPCREDRPAGEVEPPAENIENNPMQRRLRVGIAHFVFYEKTLDPSGKSEARWNNCTIPPASPCNHRLAGPVGWVERSDTHQTTPPSPPAMTDYRRNFIAGGSFFFTVNLAERRLRLLTEHIDTLRIAFRETRQNHRSRSRRWWSCPITCTPSGRCLRAMRILHALALDQDRLFAAPARRRTDLRQPRRQRRTRHLATALLGAHDQGRKGFRASRRLHSHQSGQA